MKRGISRVLILPVEKLLLTAWDDIGADLLEKSRCIVYLIDTIGEPSVTFDKHYYNVLDVSQLIASILRSN